MTYEIYISFVIYSLMYKWDMFYTNHMQVLIRTLKITFVSV